MSELTFSVCPRRRSHPPPRLQRRRPSNTPLPPAGAAAGSAIGDCINPCWSTLTSTSVQLKEMFQGARTHVWMCARCQDVKQPKF